VPEKRKRQMLFELVFKRLVSTVLSRSGMESLARRIQHELETQSAEFGHCAIYEDELQRHWPLNEENRKGKIEDFAKQFGFKLSFYKQDLCAIFEKKAAALAHTAPEK
jgi:hypothetical protein